MPASTLTLYQDFKEQLGKAVHNLSSHSFKAALTNTAPNAATHTVLADITQLSTGGGYTGGAGGGIALTTGYTETGGTGTMTATDATFTASGASVGPFRYVVVYNDTASSPADALVGYLDYGSSITLADTEQLTLDFGASLLTVA
jgi:hypothetical protein